MKDLVTKAEAAKMIGVSLSTLKYFMFRRYLSPVPTIGFRTYFLRSEVLAFKRQRMIKLRKQAKRKAQQTHQTQIHHENDNS